MRGIGKDIEKKSKCFPWRANNTDRGDGKEWRAKSPIFSGSLKPVWITSVCGADWTGAHLTWDWSLLTWEELECNTALNRNSTTTTTKTTTGAQRKKITLFKVFSIYYWVSQFQSTCRATFLHSCLLLPGPGYSTLTPSLLVPFFVCEDFFSSLKPTTKSRTGSKFSCPLKPSPVLDHVPGLLRELRHLVPRQ